MRLLIHHRPQTFLFVDFDWLWIELQILWIIDDLVINVLCLCLDETSCILVKRYVVNGILLFVLLD